MSSEKKIFISYAREDLAAAKRIYTEIKNTGGIPWIDQEDLLPGQDWDMEISHAIHNCSHFIAIISKNSVPKRGYIQNELRKALNILEQLPPGSVYIIPVRLDDSEPLHSTLGKLQRVDLFLSWEEGLKKILKSLNINIYKKSNGISSNIFADQLSEEEVLSKIKEIAAKDHPNDFSTQKFVVNKQLLAWKKIKGYRPLFIPSEVLDLILENTRRDHPFDFSTQLFIIEKQVKDWQELNQ